MINQANTNHIVHESFFILPSGYLYCLVLFIYFEIFFLLVLVLPGEGSETWLNVGEDKSLKPSSFVGALIVCLFSTD